MIRYGTIISESGGYASVLFESAGGNTVSPRFPVAQRSTVGDKDYRPLPAGTLVGVLLDEEGEGFIMGACYNKSDVPPAGSGSGVWVKEFRDGTRISYDSGGSMLTVQAAGGVTIAVEGECSITADTCNITASSGKIAGLRCRADNYPDHDFS